jgi:hypothetical protein
MKKPLIALQIITIAILGAWLYNTLTNKTQATNQTIKPNANIHPSVYFAPSDNDLMTTSFMEENSVILADTMDKIKAAKRSNAQAAIIYIHRNKINEVDRAWLQEEFTKGTAIVAFNVTIDELAALLNTTDSLDTLPVRGDALLVSGFYTNFDPLTQEVFGRGEFTNYYKNVGSATSTINALLIQNGRKVKEAK